MTRKIHRTKQIDNKRNIDFCYDNNIRRWALMRPGIGSIILIVIVALLVFGPKKLPQLGKAVGSTLREFKNATKGLAEDDDESVKDTNVNIAKAETAKDTKVDITKEDVK